MGAVVIGASVLLQLVDMVLELLAGALRVCAAGRRGAPMRIWAASSFRRDSS